MHIVTAIFLGIFIGIALSWLVVFFNLKHIIRRHLKPIGRIRVDTTDPDGPYMFLEIDNGKYATLINSKHINLEVDISQK